MLGARYENKTIEESRLVREVPLAQAQLISETWHSASVPLAGRSIELTCLRSKQVGLKRSYGARHQPKLHRRKTSGTRCRGCKWSETERTSSSVDGPRLGDGADRAHLSYFDARSDAGSAHDFFCNTVHGQVLKRQSNPTQRKQISSELDDAGIGSRHD